MGPSKWTQGLGNLCLDVCLTYGTAEHHATYRQSWLGVRTTCALALICARLLVCPCVHAHRNVGIQSTKLSTSNQQFSVGTSSAATTPLYIRDLGSGEMGFTVQQSTMCMATSGNNVVQTACSTGAAQRFVLNAGGWQQT